MDTKTFHKILQQGEGLTAEFKSTFCDEVIISLSAFSNAKGGVVYVGVSDKKEIAGITLGKETVANWINEVKNKTAPAVIPNVDVLGVADKKVVALSVVEYPVKPISFKGRYYKRVENSNHIMSLDEIANIHLQTLNTSWDFYIDAAHSLDDLSVAKIANFVKEIEKRSGNNTALPDIEFLSKMEILRNQQVTFGAYLLFAKEYCSISDVQAGRFKSPTTIIDSLSLNTDLFSEVAAIMDFIKKHLMVEYIITGDAQRTERFDYPLNAIREVVVNMVVHRDYRSSNASIIKIFDDRIEFYNPGGLYGGLTLDDLLSGRYVSKSRNKLISKAFKEVGLIERYGTGIVRIRQICEDYGVKTPDFKLQDDGFMVILYKEKTVEKTMEKTMEKNDIESDIENFTNDVPENVPEDVPKNVPENERQKRILEWILIDKKVSIDKLALEYKVNRETIKRDIAKLRELKLVERIGAARGGYWQVLGNSEKMQVVEKEQTNEEG